jgi:Ca-activated chloride channel homolog
MKIRNAASFFVLLIIGLCAAVSANAQGVIVPIICDIRPCRPIPRPIPLPNALPVKSINIDTKISGQVATTHLEQVFRNDTPYTLEGTYFFPIPETASIVEFSIWENGKKLVGEVRSREEARRIYDEIVRRQRDPGLLEYAGKDLFQASIFPIPPNSDKKLELTYSQVLKAESGTVSYRYPLGTGKNIWMQQPIPLAREGDANRPNQNPNQKIGTVSGKIEIQSPQALRNIYSPSHSIEVKRIGENKAVMTFEQSGKEQQDFQLFYGLSNNDFGLSLLTYREPGKDGYFLLILSPKDNILEREIVAKDIVFVLDTSGSMADEGKMEKARSALLFGIRNLRETDRFNVINFAGEEHLMESGLIAADASGKKRGEEFVKKLTPTGGTNINDALRASLKQFDSSDRAKLLVFMTDGLPTVGETIIEKIIQNAKEIKVENLRLFSFGVGYDVNTQLLDKIAAENSGTAEYIEPKEDLEIKASNFFAKVNSPVLTDIDLNFGTVQTDLIYPRKTPDLFRGTQLTLLGRYRNTGDLKNVVLQLRGKTGREVRNFNYENLAFPQRSEDNNFLPRLWATRRVGWLIEQIRANGEQKELRDEIVELGTRYGIVTPYTSYLAIEGAQVAGNPGFNSLLRSAPNVRPEANSRQSVITSADSAMTVTLGEEAVKASKDAKTKKEAEKLDKQTSSSVQNVGNKTFYMDENGVWIDAEFKAENKLPEIKLAFASKEFFDLIAREKELAQFFSLGEQVLVVWKGKVYRITK